ncbi:cytochrome c class I [Methylocella silvestris BL2]|uniref:Cytochrome c-L n=1 Tax=Methylocella silvestris (strain DSM 15510 / CIP 108128 / LMG 27833 / NCIMB 13906 / BL2) TaxID=395965 RepID=B8EJP2_METSB|nr:cytochrome c class I [Methylocella silvestris BL2]
MKRLKFYRNLAFSMLTVTICLGAFAQTTSLDLRNTVTGEPMSLDDALPDGRDTEGVKRFLQTGHNPYSSDKSCLYKGSQIFLTACSGCHGHLAEGKIGPGLNDDYWTYPKNQTDQGMFETIFGGAQAQMGPQSLNLTLDEILQVMSWVRHLYKDGASGAVWLTPEEKAHFKPYSEHDAPIPADSPGLCNPAAEAKPATALSK